MTKRKAFGVGLLATGVVATYCLWCARSFVLRPRLEFAASFPDGAKPVVREWLDSTNTFGREGFSGERFLKYLGDPYGKRPTVRGDCIFVGALLCLKYECAPSLSVYFGERDGIWQLQGIQEASPGPPPPLKSPVSSPSGWEEYKKTSPIPGVESAEINSAPSKIRKAEQGGGSDPGQRPCWASAGSVKSFPETKLAVAPTRAGTPQR